MENKQNETYYLLSTFFSNSLEVMLSIIFHSDYLKHTLMTIECTLAWCCDVNDDSRT